MDQIFDLFGDPVPANWGERGRPEHLASQQNRNKVSMLVALGWNNARIAATLFITQPTLRKHYFSELKFRAVARDRLIAGIGVKLLDQVQLGNVGAIKELMKFIERNDLMLYGQTHQRPAETPAKEQKLGKKEAAQAAANHPNDGTALGELMMQRQAANRPN